MVQDYRELRNLDLDELIQQARSKTLPRVTGGPVNELRRHRAFYIEQAHDIVGTAATENRAMRPDEDRTVARNIDAAKELGLVIGDLLAESNRALNGALHAVSRGRR
jgi:hypothetical protein